MLTEPYAPPRPSMARIIDCVRAYYNLREGDIQSPSRLKSIVLPRQICVYLARKHTLLSFVQIGNYIGGRDHSTAIHSLDQVEAMVSVDPELAAQITYIERDMDLSESLSRSLRL